MTCGSHGDDGNDVDNHPGYSDDNGNGDDDDNLDTHMKVVNLSEREIILLEEASRELSMEEVQVPLLHGSPLVNITFPPPVFSPPQA